MLGENPSQQVGIIIVSQGVLYSEHGSIELVSQIYSEAKAY